MKRCNMPTIDATRPATALMFEPSAEILSKWDTDISSRAVSDNVISVLDVVGYDCTASGITAKNVSSFLKSKGDSDVFVDINSPGGDLFEGIAIYNTLRSHKGKVTMRILGIAASAASLIAMAGDDIHIAATGVIMIHNAWTGAIGNRHDMIDVAAQLGIADRSMALAYAARSGRAQHHIASLMDTETWFDGKRAIDFGLADAYLPADVAYIDGNKTDARQNAHAVRRVDKALAKAGLPRNERRSLISEIKGGTQDAAATNDEKISKNKEIVALLQGLTKAIKS